MKRLLTFLTRRVHSAATLRGAVFAVLLTIPISAYAQTIAGSAPRGAELLASCRVALQTGDKTKDGAVCIAFIQGFNFGYGFAQATRDVKTICVNGDTAMTPIVQHVVDYLNTQSQKALEDTPASILVMEALEKAYPCR